MKDQTTEFLSNSLFDTWNSKQYTNVWLMSKSILRYQSNCRICTNLICVSVPSIMIPEYMMNTIEKSVSWRGAATFDPIYSSYSQSNRTFFLCHFCCWSCRGVSHFTIDTRMVFAIPPSLCHVRKWRFARCQKSKSHRYSIYHIRIRTTYVCVCVCDIYDVMTVKRSIYFRPLIIPLPAQCTQTHQRHITRRTNG